MSVLHAGLLTCEPNKASLAINLLIKRGGRKSYANLRDMEEICHQDKPPSMAAQFKTIMSIIGRLIEAGGKQRE